MNEYYEAEAWPVDDLYRFLRGSWSLYRTINDLRSNIPGAMQGEVLIEKDNTANEGDTLIYREQGELRIGDHRETVERTYVYSFPDRQHARHLGEVHFEQGGLFHNLDLSSGICKPVHHTKEDTYRGTIIVDGEDIWRQNWFVTGPSKEIILDSRYQRIVGS